MTRTKAELAAIARDGDTCLRCGRNLQGRPASVHHRKLKGRKVPKREYDVVENLVVLCGSGTTLCHGWVHANPRAAQATGWIVPSWHFPEFISLVDLRGQMIMLDPEGGKTSNQLIPLPDIEPPF